MNDTPPDVDARLTALFMQRSGSDRVRMTCEMFDLARALMIAQRAYDSGLLLAPTSFHRVLDLLPADSEIKAEPGWVTPMISFIDAREFLGNELFDGMKAGVFANRAASEEALIWINRLPGQTSLSVIFPDTAIAQESVRRYLATMKSVFGAIIDSAGEHP